MAVPVELSRVIFEAILKTFAGVDYPSVASSFDDLSKIEKDVLKLKVIL
jgi:hypothetical protein